MCYSYTMTKSGHAESTQSPAFYRLCSDFSSQNAQEIKNLSAFTSTWKHNGLWPHSNYTQNGKVCARSYHISTYINTHCISLCVDVSPSMGRCDSIMCTAITNRLAWTLPTRLPQLVRFNAWHKARWLYMQMRGTYIMHFEATSHVCRAIHNCPHVI